MSEWREYPKNKPDDDRDNPTWYDVIMKDGTHAKACAWFGDWYCFAFWYDIRKFKLEEKEKEVIIGC